MTAQSPTGQARIDARVLTNLAVGTLGGAVFAWAGMPLAWMIGAMAATIAAAALGIPMAFSMLLRTAMIAVLGITLGSMFTPETLGRAGAVLPAIALLALFLPLCVGVGYLVMRRVAGQSRPTAFFSSFPGGLTEMVLLGQSFRADTPRVSLVHAVRIVCVVAIIPVWFRFVLGHDVPSSIPGAPPLDAFPLIEVPILIGCGVLGVPLARLARVPAAVLVGPMVLSAVLHGSGLSSVPPPAPVVAGAQVVIGAAIGTRFAGLRFVPLGPVIASGALSAVLMILLAAATAWLGSHLLPWDMQVLFVAFAPGGLTEMMLIAIVIGIDPAFVTTLHMVRILMVVLLAPWVARKVLGPEDDGSGEAEIAR